MKKFSFKISKANLNIALSLVTITLLITSSGFGFQYYKTNSELENLSEDYDQLLIEDTPDSLVESIELDETVIEELEKEIDELNEKITDLEKENKELRNELGSTESENNEEEKPQTKQVDLSFSLPPNYRLGSNTSHLKLTVPTDVIANQIDEYNATLENSDFKISFETVESDEDEEISFKEPTNVSNATSIASKSNSIYFQDLFRVQFNGTQQYLYKSDEFIGTPYFVYKIICTEKTSGAVKTCDSIIGSTQYFE